MFEINDRKKVVFFYKSKERKLIHMYVSTNRMIESFSNNNFLFLSNLDFDFIKTNLFVHFSFFVE